MMNRLDLYQGKTVLVTGHTGFKGSWMCKALEMLGANVVGYALNPPTEPNLFSLLKSKTLSVIGDIRDLDKLCGVVEKYSPELVIHMAAQPIVRESYKNPVYTYETNVMGTVNICEAIRRCESVRSFVNVTTDKVYKNNEWAWGYRETDVLDGYDPYSNSKSCSELVTASYGRSFLRSRGVVVSTCRAGNVIGGGDFAADRIIPDCVRAVQNGDSVKLRNPYSTRPYQHVLEPVFAYLTLAAAQYEDPEFAGNYNIGPDDRDCVATGELADIFCKTWGDGAKWENVSENGAPHEANFLKLDCSKISAVLGWRPRLHINEAVQMTVEWSKTYINGGNVNNITEKQIMEYMESTNAI